VVLGAQASSPAYALSTALDGIHGALVATLAGEDACGPSMKAPILSNAVTQG